MKNYLLCCGAFIAGTIAGGASAYFACKNKFDNEVESIRETYRQMKKELQASDEENVVEEIEKELDDIIEEESYTSTSSTDEYANAMVRYGYSKEEVEKLPGVKNVEDIPNEDEPYVIMPDDYGDIDTYEVRQLTLYSDGYLCDEDDNIVNSDIPATIGKHALENIGKYEEDIVHIRNDALGIDYEICKDPRSYEEMFLLE